MQISYCFDLQGKLIEDEYTYVQNNPVNYVDPSGYTCCPTKTNVFKKAEPEKVVNALADFKSKRYL